MGAALVLLLVGLGAMAAGVLIGRYYVPDDRQLRRTARHSRAYMRALSHLIARDHETVVTELRSVVEENIDDVEPYFALGAMFRSRGEIERAIRVHQALALRERDKRKLRQRAMYELGLDFRAAGMPRRATRAMEEVLLEEPGHQGALRALAALYEEQARFNEAAGLWQRLGRRRNEDTSGREHHLLVAAAQTALGRDDVESAKQLLKAAHKHKESAHFFAAAAELAAARGNHRGVRERLKQALVEDPALAPHVLPGLIAAEQGLAAEAIAGGKGKPPAKRDDLLDEDDAPERPSTPQLAAATSTALATTDAGVIAAGSARGELIEEGPPRSKDHLHLTPSPVPHLAGGQKPTLASADAGAIAAGSGAKPTLDTAAQGVSLVPDARPGETVTDRVLAVLAEVEAQTGPRLELALIRAQLAQAAGGSTQAEVARDLATRFPDALASRVATGRLALANEDPSATRQSLDLLVGESGMLAWALRGRWQCGHCGHRPGPFSWRCGQCRRWNTLRMETGVEPPPIAPRDRRAAPRTARPDGLLGATPDVSLPSPTLDPGLTEEELARGGARRSLLGRVGGWFSGAWRR